MKTPPIPPCWTGLHLVGAFLCYLTLQTSGFAQVPSWGTPLTQTGIAAATCAGPSKDLVGATIPPSAAYTFEPPPIPSNEANLTTWTKSNFLAVINLPNNGAEDSYNILPAMLGQPLNQPIREATIHHSSKGKFAIRQDQWVLLDHPGSGGNGYDVDTGEIQLYNLQTDASQEQNLVDKNPDRVSKLRALLEKYKESGRSRP